MGHARTSPYKRARAVIVWKNVAQAAGAPVNRGDDRLRRDDICCKAGYARAGSLSDRKFIVNHPSAGRLR